MRMDYLRRGLMKYIYFVGSAHVRGHLCYISLSHTADSTGTFVGFVVKARSRFHEVDAKKCIYYTPLIEQNV